VVSSVDGMSLDRLASTPKFGSAWVNATFQGSDGDGNAIEIGITMQWAPVEAFERSRVSGNGWFPANGQQGALVHTFSHGQRAAAMAWGEVTIEGQALSLSPTTDASLEQVRYFCQVIQHPRGGFEVDC
jgi:hypothetical protein